MKDLRQSLQEMLGLGNDQVEIVPIPINADRMVRLRTLEEALEDFDSDDESAESLGFLIQVKPPRKAAPTAVSQPTLPPSGGAGGHQVYLQDGKLNVPFLFRSAELLFSSGDYALARNVYKTILQSGERTASALFGTARCHEAEGRHEEACVRYEESIAYQPTLEAYQRLAALLLHLHRDGAAAETLERALHLKDLSPSLRFELHKACGNSYTRAARLAEAERNFLRCLELDPQSDEIRTSLAAAYLQGGKIEDAKRAFQDAISANPQNDKALAGLASCFFTEGDKRSAHDFFARSLEIRLPNPHAIFHLVKCAYEIRSYATAARLTEQYIQVAPINTHLLYSLAGLQFHLGRLADAHGTATRILELSPSHSGAQELLALIERNTRSQ